MDLHTFVAIALGLSPQAEAPPSATAAGGLLPAAPATASPPAPPGVVVPGAGAAPFTCPEGTKPVWGEHVESLQRLCTDWRQLQCWRWFSDVQAFEGRRTPIATCMDEHEWPNRRGEEPVVMVRFVEAKIACESVGKRLCTEFEWETACEGPARTAFPYGDRHEPHACNNDKRYRSYGARALESKDARVRDAEVKRLWQGEPSGSRPRCVSAFGVVDLVGNAEEWVLTSRPEWPHVSSLKGGYWSKPWSGCRGTNDSHGPMFRFYETGFRCCADPVRTTDAPAG